MVILVELLFCLVSVELKEEWEPRKQFLMSSIAFQCAFGVWNVTQTYCVWVQLFVNVEKNNECKLCVPCSMCW